LGNNPNFQNPGTVAEEVRFVANNSTGKKMPKWLKFLLIVVPLAGVLLCGGGYVYVTSWPQYIELDVPLPRPSAWRYTEKTVQVQHIGESKFYIWRRKTTLSIGEAFDNQASIIDYFDNWLAENGWERDARGRGCNVYVPERDFLGHKFDGFVRYRRSDSSPYRAGPRVCLIIWPTETDSDYYHVVFLTTNPSPLTALLRDFD
jgi:hypothetical protein